MGGKGTTGSGGIPNAKGARGEGKRKENRNWGKIKRTVINTSHNYLCNVKVLFKGKLDDK